MPEVFLNRCAKEGVFLRYAARIDETELRVVLAQKDLPSAAAIAQRSQCELTVLHRRGGRALTRHAARRWLPAACLLLSFLLLAWSKLYIWEIDVTGNETVSAGRIRSALSDCGVSLGSFWPDIRSDLLRCELLLRLPELAWATVNIHGSRAEVVVRERVPKPELFDSREPVDLVAERLGFVTEVRALSGTPAVRPGSAVMPGEVLISGASDSAFSGQREGHAVGSVTAETCYELTATAPLTETVCAETAQRRRRWALLIGKNRVNLYKNSSFCPPNCDKIISIWECKIPGLFSLPLALVRETAAQRVTEERERDLNLLRRAMEQQLHARLLDAVDGGIIEEEHYSCARSDGRMTVCLRARCSENIAKEQKR
jgi:similar to stage IV sporulation protein